MSYVARILVRPVGRAHLVACCVLGALTGCGQKGALFVPTGPEATERATLVETVVRPFGGKVTPQPAVPAPPAVTAPPARQP